MADVIATAHRKDITMEQHLFGNGTGSVGVLNPDPTTNHRADGKMEGGARSFLLVHGAWHAAAHWNEVVEHLTAMGHRAYAIDLPGSGLSAAYPESFLRNDFASLSSEVSPIGNLRLSDYSDAVVAQIRRMARHGKVTLVGHSFGGLTVTRAAEPVPHLVNRVVYISAYVPVKLANGAGYATLPEAAAGISGAMVIADPAVTGAVRINPRDASPEYLEKGWQAFYNDIPAQEYVKFAAYMNPDLPAAVGMDEARGTAERWGKVPRTFVRCTLDQTVPPALQDRMIAEADDTYPDNKFDIVTLRSSHSPFASMPGLLAHALSRRA